MLASSGKLYSNTVTTSNSTYTRAIQCHKAQYILKTFLLGEKATFFSCWLPVKICQEKMTCLQAEIHFVRAYTAFSVSLIQKHAFAACIVGYNLVLDYLFENTQSRICVGAECSYKNIQLESNFYFPVAAWKACTESSSIYMRPASGINFQLKIRSNKYSSLAGTAGFESNFRTTLNNSYKNFFDRKQAAFNLAIAYQIHPWIGMESGLKIRWPDRLAQPFFRIYLVFQKRERFAENGQKFTSINICSALSDLQLGWIQREKLIAQEYVVRSVISVSDLQVYKNKSSDRWNGFWIKPKQRIYLPNHTIREVSAKIQDGLQSNKLKIEKEDPLKRILNEKLTSFNPREKYLAKKILDSSRFVCSENMHLAQAIESKELQGGSLRISLFCLDWINQIHSREMHRCFTLFLVFSDRRAAKVIYNTKNIAALEEDVSTHSTWLLLEKHVKKFQWLKLHRLDQLNSRDNDLTKQGSFFKKVVLEKRQSCVDLKEVDQLISTNLSVLQMRSIWRMQVKKAK